MGKTSKVPARLRLRDFLRRKIGRRGAAANYTDLVEAKVVANSKLSRLKGEEGENTTLKTLDDLAEFFGAEPWELLHPDPETAGEAMRLSAAALKIARKMDDLPLERQDAAYALFVQLVDFQNVTPGKTAGAPNNHDSEKPTTTRPTHR